MQMKKSLHKIMISIGKRNKTRRRRRNFEPVFFFVGLNESKAKNEEEKKLHQGYSMMVHT